MRIELTIKTTYLPKWGVWEGIRELVQNAKDAETEFGAAMTVRHRKESDTLVIENEGTTLPHEALLLGFTSKQDRSDTIGKFGEGLKLGILALVRFGLKVKIRSGSEVWVPAIARSEKFDANVLVFDVYKGRKFENRVSIEVGGFDSEAWSGIRSRFLFLTKPKALDCTTTHAGSLLCHADHLGKVYVKGILVSSNSGLQYGYDLSDAEIDRDRKMVDSYDLGCRTNAIWMAALEREPALASDYMRLLESQAKDVDGMSGAYRASQISNESQGRLVDLFKAKHGPNALPVQSLAESADIEHLGMQGVVVSAALRVVLERSLGTAEQNALKLRKQPLESFGWHQLSEEERTNLTSAIELVNAQEPLTIADVDVRSFRDEAFEGFFRDGRVLLAKKVLADRSKTLLVLVHETAHKAGGADGDKAHVANLERIWSGIVAGLRG